jgi:uncharacterized protein
MTPDEQHMIQDLFQRLAAQGRVAKDPQADRVINDAVRSNPDAAYMLVQTALVYEHQMNEQEQRLRELEDQIAQMQRSSAPQASSGSFLGGRIGAGRGAVPDVGARSQSGSYAQASSQPQASSPWSSTPAQQSSFDRAPQQPQQRGMFGGGAPAQGQAAPAAGGGFLRSALTTAAGVAGGMMVASSLSNMFGGGSANAATPAADNAAMADANATQDELQDAQYQEPDAASDLGGWDDIET